MTRRLQTLDGLPVYDATEPLFIEVTRPDIRMRDRKNPQKCALAEACKRELHVTEARAYLSRLYIRQRDHWLRYELPEPVRQEVASFDRGGGFSEGTYRIMPLSPSRRSGKSSQGGHGNNRTGQKRQMTVRHVAGVRAHSPLMGGALENITKTKGT